MCMVSSGTVDSDLSTITGTFSKYDSLVGEVDGYWKGNSCNNFKEKASEFSSSFSSTINSQMTAFSEACNLYEQYIVAKSNYNTAQSNYNIAIEAGKTSDANEFSSKMDSYKDNMNSLKEQIVSKLATVSSTRLEASNFSASVSSGSSIDSNNNNSNSTLKDWSDDSNFSYFNQSDGWKDYKYSNGGQNSMSASGCGPTAMAMVLNSMGHDEINPNVAADWSANHGYHTNGTEEEYFKKYPESLGINSTILGKDKDAIKSHLSNNEMVLLHVGPGSYGDFTKMGHYIVARAYDPETDKVLIADPNKTKNNTWHDLDRVINQLKGEDSSWAYSL